MATSQLAADIAWGIVNSFHFTAKKLERREETLVSEIGDMARRHDPSEVFNRDLEDKQLLCQSIAEQRGAIECTFELRMELWELDTQLVNLDERRWGYQ